MKDAGNGSTNASSETMRRLRHDVPRQVHGAALLLRLRQKSADGFGNATVVIPDYEPHAREAPVEELRQEVTPALVTLLRANSDGQEMAMAVKADAVGHERRDVLDAARPAGVHVGRVEEEGTASPERSAHSEASRCALRATS